MERGRLIADISFSRVDLERLIRVDANGDGRIVAGELAAARVPLETMARGALEVRFEGRVSAPNQVSLSVDSISGVHFHITFPGASVRHLSIRSALLTRLPRGHRQYLSLRDRSGRLLAEQMLDAKHDAVQVDTGKGIAPGAAPGPFRQFLALGVHHILGGYDHLLFLFGLLLPGFGFRTALTIITSFTLAHSLTLTLATFDLVRVPSSWVEPLIALSIVYVGVENLSRSTLDRRWLLTFGFGLVHGLGFAAVPRDLGIGSGGGAIVPLLSFNLGVEVGQMGIAALILPLIWKLRERPLFARWAVPVGSGLVALAGGYWLIQRTLFS